MTPEHVNDLEYEGDAWVKVAELDVRSHGSGRFRAHLAKIVRRWRDERSIEAARTLCAELVDDLLCEHLPESSYFAEYDRGPWIVAEDFRERAAGLFERLGCAVAVRPYAWFLAFADRADVVFRLDDDDIVGLFALDHELGVFFIDRG